SSDRDWSSDVCSSDLVASRASADDVDANSTVARGIAVARNDVGCPGRGAADRIVGRTKDEQAIARVAKARHTGRVSADPVAENEIGRASCRESGTDVG